MSEHDYSAYLAAQCRSIGLPDPIRELRFAKPDRQWRFDLAWPDAMIAAEIEGGGWVNGRHNRPAGYAGDCEKYNSAILRGWRVFRFVPAMLYSGEAVATLEKVLKGA